MKKESINKDNISLYYEFMSNDDLKKYKDILEDIFISRKRKLLDTFFKCGDETQNNIISIYAGDSRTELMHTFYQNNIGLICFGIKDTLKPIDEFIEEIKQSKKYEEHKKEIFLINGKSKEASNVLKLLDNDYSYKEAMEKTLQNFKNISKRDLEIELDIYI